MSTDYYGSDDRALIGITTLQSDPDRAARIRQRCRSIIERRARAGSASASEIGRAEVPTAAQAAARQALVGAYGILCVVYVLSLVLTTMQLQGMWR